MFLADQVTLRATAGEFAGRNALDIALRARRRQGGSSKAPPSMNHLVNVLRDASDVAALRQQGSQMFQGVGENESKLSSTAGGTAGGEEGEMEGSSQPQEAEPVAEMEGEGESNEAPPDVCSTEGIRWLPEIRLYGADRGLGQGISLLGRCVL